MFASGHLGPFWSGKWMTSHLRWSVWASFQHLKHKSEISKCQLRVSSIHSRLTSHIKNHGMVLMTKIGSSLDRPIWPVIPGGLTGLRWCSFSGRADRSDRSMRSLSTIREFYRFRSVNRISWGVNLLHPININGHDRLGIQPNRINKINLSLSFLSFCLVIPLFQPQHVVLLSSSWRLRTPYLACRV